MSKLSVPANQKDSSALLLTSFSAWSFVLLCRPQDYLPFLDQLRPGLVLGVVTLCVWILSAKNGGKKLPLENQVKLYGYLLLVLVLSIPFSYYRSASLQELFRYGSVALFVFLFYRLMNDVEKIRKLLFVYCIGIAAYGLSILTKGSLVEGRISFGTMFDPNDIAFYMLGFITFNLFFLSRDNSRLVRLISLACFLLSLLIIIKTGSRGGFIALMAVLAFFLFKRGTIFKISFLHKFLLVLLAVISLQFIDLDLGRFRTIVDYKDDYNVTSEEGRIAIWKRGMKMMVTHPLTGIGFNIFPEGMGRDREARGLGSAKWQTAHNSLVQIGAETGIIGFILFLVLSLNAYRIFAETARGGGDAWLAKLGVLAQAGFVGNFIAAMFLSQAYSVIWAFYIVLSAALNRLRIERIETA
ncbi:MAG: O-antigen ligase family protein [Desulfuromonadaceae bacterium]|nr:O-antigen ligase family protein [Desulfuromonadaceae bacterium]MDD2848969.1 O-antigen ligase family protein [Desulfuromonadaceae bacterium]MDD4130318.1 O-antigen ligase family protein [Desulfuromonadaceae bacterium]